MLELEQEIKSPEGGWILLGILFYIGVLIYCVAWAFALLNLVQGAAKAARAAARWMDSNREEVSALKRDLIALRETVTKEQLTCDDPPPAPPP